MSSLPSNVEPPTPIQFPVPEPSSDSKHFNTPPSYNESAAPPLDDSKSSRIAPVKDTMLEYLRDYDTVIIVDDSGSMMAGDRWGEAGQALQAFAEIAVQYDSDGIEISFFNNRTVVKHVVSGQQVSGLFNSVRPNGGTPIGRVLETRISEYLEQWEAPRSPSGSSNVWNKFVRFGKKKEKAASPPPSRPKPINVLVITDGQPTDDPQRVILDLSRRMDKLSLPLHQVGIQFVQIGDDAEATQFLRELDDYENSDEPIPRDIIDTEPYRPGEKVTDAKLVKVLVGAINRRIDQRDKKLRQRK